MKARCQNKPACGGLRVFAAFGMTEPSASRHFKTRPEISHETARLMRAPASARGSVNLGNPGELPGWQPKVRSARGRAGRSPVSATKSAWPPGLCLSWIPDA